MATDGRAFTGTPDPASGNAIDITLVTNASSQVVDRQTVSIGDPSTITRVAVLATGASASANDPALVVGISPNSPITVKQGAAGASAWLISGPVTLATGAATIGAVQLVTGANPIGSIATGSATLGQIVNATGSATMGLVVLATGANPIGSIATGSATLGVIVNATGSATMGLVGLVTGGAVIGVLGTGSATLGAVSLVTGSATLGLVVLATGTAAIGSIATGSATLGSVVNVTSTATIGYVVPVTPARTNVLLSWASVTGVTTEALGTLQIVKGGAAVTAATVYSVTTGKTFRVQAIQGSVVGTGASGNSARFMVRSAAAVTVASVAIAQLVAHNNAATAAVGGSAELPIVDGIEVGPGPTQIGVSHIDSGTANTTNFTLIGYEYTP